MSWDSHIPDLRSILTTSWVLHFWNKQMATITWVFISQIISLGTNIFIKSLPKQTRLLDSLLVIFTHECPQQTKEAAYRTLVRPLVEYSSAVWDPYTQDLILKKCKKEQHALCVATLHLAEEGCVSNMIKSLDWDSLANRCKIHRLTVFQQARQSHLSLPVETLLQPVQRHSRHLHANAYNIISTNKDCMKYSFFPRTIINWNSLPEPIINIASIPQFKQALINLHEMPNTKNPCYELSSRWFCYKS